MWFERWLTDRNFSAVIGLDAPVILCFYLLPLYITIRGERGGRVIKWDCIVVQPCKRSSNACISAPVGDVSDSAVSFKV